MAIARAKGLSDEKSVVPYRLHGRTFVLQYYVIAIESTFYRFFYCT